MKMISLYYACMRYFILNRVTELDFLILSTKIFKLKDKMKNEK